MTRQSTHFEETISQAGRVPEPDMTRRAAARRAFLVQAARLRQEQSRFMRSRRYRWAAVPLSFLFVLLGSVGVTQAADSALPGDPLYGIDRGVEQAQLAVASPDQRGRLQLDQLDERLFEAETLVIRGDDDNLALALDAYSDTANELTGNVALNDNQAERLARLESKLAEHTARLEAIQAQAPEAAQAGLQRAIEASQKGRQRAMEAIQQGGRPDTPGRDSAPGQQDSENDSPDNQDQGNGQDNHGNNGTGQGNNGNGQGNGRGNNGNNDDD